MDVSFIFIYSSQYLKNVQSILSMSTSSNSVLVTKAMEKGELELLICCRHVRPFVLVQHLPVLASIHSVPICSLGGPNTSFQLGRIFGLRTMMAIGFRKQGAKDTVTEATTPGSDNSFRNLIDFCLRKSTTPNVPWLASSIAEASTEDVYKDTRVEPRTKKQRAE